MISAIVITKNEEKMIEDCLKSLAFVDEIIVVDTGNTDNTNKIANSFGAKIVKSSGDDYSKFRNDGLKHATGDWILFVDADERVSPELKSEIHDLSSSAYLIPRKNIYLGHEMHYGGWGNEKLIRIFKKSSLKGYRGELHEQPNFTGELGELTGPLIHLSHRGLSSMLEKTLLFTNYEAKLRFQAGHPPIVPWRIFRVMLTEFWHRFIVLQAWRDGPAGIIDGLFQIYNMFIIYARLWELQHDSSHS